MALTPEEQRELDQLEFDKLEAEKRASVVAPSPAEPPTASGVPPAVAASGRQEWTSGSPMERAALMLSRFGTYGKQPAINMANSAANLGLRGAPPAAGQAIGAATGPFAPFAVPALGAIGGAGGEALAQFREGKMRPGAMLGAAVTGAIPGASLAKAGAGAVAKEASKNAAGNITAKAVEVYRDEGRMPTLQEVALAGGAAVAGTGLAKALDKGLNPEAIAEALKRAQDATRRETLKLGRELGYVLPPSVVRPNLANNTMNSIGGKAATAQEVIQRNQPMTNKAVREELGLPDDTSFSVQTLNAAKVGPMGVYKTVESASPAAKIALDMFKEESGKANMVFSEMISAPPGSRGAFKPKLDAAKANVKQAEQLLEQELIASGNPDLFAQFKEARIKLGKTAIVEEALNKGGGTIDAAVIGRAYDADPKRLTGKLASIGRFQNAFSQAVKDAQMSPPSGVNQLLPVLGASGAMYAGGPAAAVATIGAFLGGPPLARQSMLSKPYQDNFMDFAYGPTRQDAQAMLARFAMQSEGRQPNQPPPLLARP